MSLFRSEVLEHRRDRLHGDVNMVLPISWQTIGILFFVIIVTAIVFLTFAGYSRIETVSGIIAPEGGITRIVPPRTGVIGSLMVNDGDTVERGDPLVVVRTNETLAGGAESSSKILESLRQQEKGLLSQEQQIAASTSAGRAQFAARISGLEADIIGLRERIAVQEGLVESAKTELDGARKIAERGFVSRRDILQREETYLGRQQQLSQLRQTLAGQQAAIVEARAAMRQAGADAGAQVAALSSQRSDIAQRRTGVEAGDAFRLNAPIAGKVTALTARTGQAVSPQESLMLIVPEGSDLRVELYVPSAAIGFLDVGQDVRLALDAFPYQRFGTVPARVASIASAPVVQQGADGQQVPVYLVTATLRSMRVDAYGNEEPLIAGMTLTARIVTEEQSLLEWLFEPIFAVRER